MGIVNPLTGVVDEMDNNTMHVLIVEYFANETILNECIRSELDWRETVVI
jgi:hypothetical protein